MNDKTIATLLRAQGIETSDMKDQSPAQKSLMRVLGRYAAPTIALAGPSAPDTWGVRADLQTDEPQTARIPLTFPADVIIVGMLPCVTYTTFNPTVGGVVLKDPATGGGPLEPCDIDVSFDIDTKLRLTSQQGRSSATGLRDGAFVNLASFDIIRSRLMMYLLEGVPQVGFTFRSRYAIDSPAASGFLAPVRISLELFTRPLGY